MKKSKAVKPTDSELAILRVLWELGPVTVREVWEQISPVQHTGYTTVLKTMQIMFDKGFVERDDTFRSHVYRARVSREQTQRQVVGHLLERVFGGSASQLVIQALTAKKTSPTELAEIRRLLDEMEGGAE